jgi:hypothetical protein
MEISMKRLFTVARVAVLMLIVAPVTARATTIFETTTALTASDPTQLGRLSRNGIAQDWAGTEVYPGEINTSTPYFYHTYLVNVGDTPFIQVDFDTVPTSTFVSAYLGSYNPASKSTNWLGDAGVSGNSFGTDPLFFQVVVPLGADLIVVVNSTVAGDGFDPFHLTVEGFIDTEFTDPPSTAPVPEPATLLLSASGMAFMGLRRRLRQRA